METGKGKTGRAATAAGGALDRLWLAALSSALMLALARAAAIAFQDGYLRSGLVEIGLWSAVRHFLLGLLCCLPFLGACAWARRARVRRPRTRDALLLVGVVALG